LGASLSHSDWHNSINNKTMFYLNQTTHQSNSATAWLLGLLCAVLMLTAGVTFADEDAPNDDPLGVNRLPEIAKDIGVDSKLGDIIDFDVPFHDEENRFVRIGQYFKDKPVVLSFNYSNCPKLCSVQLENMVNTLVQTKFKVGKDFEMISISIDPLEQVSRAKQAKEKYSRMYNDGESVDGFHFLTGDAQEIKYMTELCGFRYKYVPRQKLYSHSPVFILISPKGKIARYIHGLDYDPVTIERALVETAEGKIGSPINHLAWALGCYLFDESTGKYTFQAMAIMRIGAFLTMAALVVGLVPYWFFRKGNRKKIADDEPLIDTHAEPNPLS